MDTKTSMREKPFERCILCSGGHATSDVCAVIPVGDAIAVRAGVAISTGRYVMFADSGVCIPYEQALRGLALLRDGSCDIAGGARAWDFTT